MKISTTISVTATMHNGESVVLERTVVSNHGDTPSFHRGEVIGALDVARGQFIEANALDGTRPL